ncbi:hypothetical protein PAN31117_04129 [Pandoraea anapnoica]|uniref:Uncharacterized protein n=1 Tax=Pandoraea anapnoica TaxID=2508301 RepID=A0A5E5AHV3_9BURK|nr:hypothetical protein PAN31117_04129 [Pandoraea anapnoica]
MRSAVPAGIQAGFLRRGLLARCRGDAVRVNVSGLIVGTGAIVSSHCSRPRERTTRISVRNDEPLPLSRFRRVRTLIPALSESVAWSRFRCIRSVFKRSPSFASISAGVRCLWVLFVVFTSSSIFHGVLHQPATLLLLTPKIADKRQTVADCCEAHGQCRTRKSISWLTPFPKGGERGLALNATLVRDVDLEPFEKYKISEPTNFQLFKK